jgi:hypothetical protein
VIEERSPESSLKEVVEEHSIPCSLPQIGLLHRGCAVIAHGKAPGVREQGKSVVGATIDLRTVGVEQVREPARHRANAYTRAHRINREWSVGQLSERN